MRLRIAIALAGLLVLAVSAVQAQTPMRVRGTITAVDGHTVAVKNRDGQDLKVVLTDKTAIAAVQALKLSDIKAGDGVGATTRPGPGGTLTALEVHVFPTGMPIPGEGHRPWDLEPGSMMTNARVTAVVQSPIVTAVPADRSALKPGEYVFFGAEKAADGTLTPTGRIQVSRDGVKPPM
jgi:hypothetical protein